MRITLTPKNQKEKEPPFKNNKVYRFGYEFYKDSGNIHIIKTEIIEQIHETINNDVIVVYEDNHKDIVENYEISGIEDI